jgi:hypothetical protein
VAVPDLPFSLAVGSILIRYALCAAVPFILIPFIGGGGGGSGAAVGAAIGVSVLVVIIAVAAVLFYRAKVCLVFL